MYHQTETTNNIVYKCLSTKQTPQWDLDAVPSGPSSVHVI